MNDALMKRLKAFLLREDNITLLGSPATEDEISNAQQRLHVDFYDDYLQFIRTFGGAYVGLAVYAFSNGSSLGKESVVDLTLRFREQFQSSDFAETLQTSYVISMDGSGDPIFIDQAGQVFMYDHLTGEIKLTAASFESLIENNFIEW
ncbi:SMI1/KNR4 family protein [Paenibacillus chibensis]|uniref:SMI1/KNR4 family protein n=1 Tax=Paenibacillus chibensis TaxID=59846 RepID=UPI000FDABC1A|nr:SMI1/KNR4 family protein [Paenibacillus chibensis]MEC0372272.1 SMI1/KNR4 family protein [Paenibacillus chibensis]